jgi:hypothetical protein
MISNLRNNPEVYTRLVERSRWVGRIAQLLYLHPRIYLRKFLANLYPPTRPPSHPPSHPVVD